MKLKKNKTLQIMLRIFISLTGEHLNIKWDKDWICISK